MGEGSLVPAEMREAAASDERMVRPAQVSRGRASLSQATENGGGNVRVEIFDQTYHLRGTDGKYIGQLADYVDTKMRLISQQVATVDSMRVAVLAALNIADELHVLKRKYDAIANDYQERTEHLAGALDEVLEEKRKVG
jgi:cell division protein ZapA